MQAKNKNSISILLMICSIALMLVLQVLWLNSSYRTTYSELQKEINNTFRNTVLAMQDSMIQKHIIPYQADSIGVSGPRFFAIKDSMHLPRLMKDSAINFINIKDKSVRVQVFATSKTTVDSSDHSVRALISKLTQLQNKAGASRTFVIRLGLDSLRTDSLGIYFQKNLLNAGVSLPFSILSNTRNRKIIGDLIVSEVVPINPICSYTAIVKNVNSYILKKIAAQILFSVFTTLLTSFAFFILYRNLRSQQQLMELKNSFIGNITHELKTPIATVSVALEALRDFDALKDPKRTQEYLSMAQNELKRLTLLTDNVLRMTTLENNGTKILKQPVNIAKITERVLQSMKLIFEKQQANVSLIKEGEHFELNGNEIHLTNVVYNFIDNALKYSRAPIVITIQLIEKQDHIELSIKDNGIGIPKEYRKKIFEKFFRVPTGNIHDAHGYGLGLNYVAEVINQHEGTIEVESEPGFGSKFIVQLPKLNQA